MKDTVYYILGQTATGKTDMAAEVARSENGEIINCDSRQIYKYLNIITGKTDNPADVPIHCTDLVEPAEPFSAYEFAVSARKAIDKVIDWRKKAVVTGGTGMYAYLLKYFDPSLPAAAIKLPQYFDNFTLVELQEKIQSEYYFIWKTLNESDRGNKRRLSAALQRLLFGSSSLVNLDSKNCLANKYKIKEKLLLFKDATSLETKLKARIDKRLKMGAVKECENLLAAGYGPSLPGLATIGYQSIFRMLRGEMSEEQMIGDWLTKERQYAKRQKTYLLKYFPRAEIIYV